MKIYCKKLNLKKLLVVSFVSAFCLTMLCATSAYACNIFGQHFYGDGDGEEDFDVSHLALSKNSFHDSDGLRGDGYVKVDKAIATNADFSKGDRNIYDFSDKDGNYDIYNLTLVCEEDVNRQDSKDVLYRIYFVYDTDTIVDFTGEKFTVKGQIKGSNDEVFYTFEDSWRDFSDADDYDYEQLDYYTPCYFKEKCGCGLVDGIKNGNIKVELTDFHCSSH